MTTDPAEIVRAERRRWTLRGLFGGAVAGAALLTFLVFAAGHRVEITSGGGILAAYALMTPLSAALGAGLGWLHGDTAARAKLAADAPEPTRWRVMLEEAGKGYRIGLAVAILYCVVTLGVMLEARVFPPWLLALRAAIALVLFPLGVAAIGLLIGLSKPR